MSNNGDDFADFSEGPGSVYLCGMVHGIVLYRFLYPKKIFDDKKLSMTLTAVFLLLSWCSVAAGVGLLLVWERDILSLCGGFQQAAGSCLIGERLSFFKNLGMGYHPWVNRIAASAFGVLMIHANSDNMRRWLWRDVLDNVSAYHEKFFVAHAVGAVLGIYVVCTLIDIIRIRFIEKPF